MHYLIFVPNVSAGNPQNLVNAGLGDLLRPDDESPLCADLVGRGPGELPGQIWSWGNAIPAYLPDQQTWTPSKSGSYWIGTTNASPPKPEDLLRKKPIEGLDPVVMADGREWIIPSVLRLPMVFDIDENDEPLRVPHPRHKAFSDECCWALGEVMKVLKTQSPPDWKRAFSFGVMAISINYRVNRFIAVHLGILDEDVLFTIMAKATDAAAVQDVLNEAKKKAGVSVENG